MFVGSWYPKKNLISFWRTASMVIRCGDGFPTDVSRFVTLKDVYFIVVDLRNIWTHTKKTVFEMVVFQTWSECTTKLFFLSILLVRHRKKDIHHIVRMFTKCVRKCVLKYTAVTPLTWWNIFFPKFQVAKTKSVWGYCDSIVVFCMITMNDCWVDLRMYWPNKITTQNH